jgi:hypothetical protein
MTDTERLNLIEARFRDLVTLVTAAPRLDAFGRMQGPSGAKLRLIQYLRENG